MTRIALEGLTKRFAETTAVDAVDLEVPTGELFFVLGPSGCGKSTLLRAIAGFIAPDAGRIRFDGRDVTGLPPNRRNTGMVFQSYALWPHMTVLDNVAYGLKVRRIPADTRRRRATAALRAVHMEALAGRRPGQLSGGQQQRVALARALVVEPDVLLLDEPLSNLDAALRHEMRLEIRRICEETKITTIYVTHDQKEALSMADTVAVFREGRVVQVGPPQAIYARPSNRFVAGFLGESNFLEATVTARDDSRTTLETPAGRLTSASEAAAGARVSCSIRPEAIRIHGGDTPSADNALAGRHVRSEFLGDRAQHMVEVADGVVLKVLQLNPGQPPSPDEPVTLLIDAEDVVILDA